MAITLASNFQKAMTPVTEGFYASPEFASFGSKNKLLPVSTTEVDSPYFGVSQGVERTAAMDKAYEAFKARTTGGVKPVLTAAIAKDLIYRSSTTGVPTAELNLYGGLSTVKAAAAKAGLDVTPADIQKYEIQNNLPESASTKLNKQFIGAEGAVLLDQLETALNSSNPAIAQQARDSLNAQQKAAEQQVIAERQAATTAGTTAATTGGGLLSVPTGTGTTATTGTTAATGAKTGAVTLPTAAELQTMSQGSVAKEAATPVKTGTFGTGSVKTGTFGTGSVRDARADEAAFTAAGKAKNDADQIRQAYLSVLGRVPDAAGYKYFSDRFGTDVDAAELEIFRTMAAPELAARTTTGTTAGTGATTAGTGATTATGMSITQAYQQVLGRTPNAQEIAYWTNQFGASVDPTELSNFSVAAQPELAAAPTTNNAIRQMYLSVLGREPDATGLKYFSDRFGADVDATELGIFRGMSTQEIAANAARNVGTTTGTAGGLTGPTTPTQVTGTQLAPAQVTNTAITGTPYRNVYTPATMQQNAPTLAQINAASQSANPYQSLMALTPQRTLSPGYAAQAGLTTANTNLGGFNPAIYNPPAAATTTGGGLLTTVEQPGSADTSTGTGMAGINNQAALSAAVSDLGFTGLGQTLATSVGNQLGSLNEADILGGNYSFPGAISSPVSSSNVVGTSLGPLGATSSPVFSSNVVGTDIGDFGGTGGLGGAYSGGSSDPALNYKGGLITRQKVKGPNPPGPDDGYSGLDIGEYVIKKSAVKKYGANIFEQINAGRIPAQRLKSLLE